MKYPIEKSPKNAKNFLCETCNYKCSKQSDFNKHLLTNKHKILQNPTENPTKNLQINENTKLYFCKCGKKYKHSSTLYAHKKKCEYDSILSNEINKIENNDIYKLIEYILKENGELKTMMLEQQNKIIEQQTIMLEITKNSQGQTINSNNNNCNNKTFNLHFFLNETCKDALNMSDFVDLIKPTLEDLENTGRKGYVEGITDLILKNLKALEQCKRPIHCSDLKRAVLYVKDKDKWEKEAEDKPILTNAIKFIAHENIKQIQEWKKKNPDCTDSESRKNNLYLNIVSNSMSGINEEECEKNMSKIISNVVKESVIQKDI